ncbi:protein phosphatase [Asanoa sp. WMMD1127]|uniref:protein-tyrosine phosphatase family protein n=1 Tax=Asanoa sp. WMMD1127 TaxID=3016107 RepID=UPI002415C20A|nr:protein phosphatase [Asanoa sp. WMMD1127]MDG4820321.1 protein phosphatase [Asanoa sp. WMMD1127]
MIDSWDPAGPGVLRLPSGRLIRGRGLLRAYPMGPPPTFGIYLLGKPASSVAWESRWVRWPDLWLPSDPADAAHALHEAWERAASDRVELACRGGRGRTGTALACLAIIDGVAPREAVAYVREHYDRRAVETPWQKRFVARFAAPDHPNLN